MRGLAAHHLLPAEGHDIQLVPRQIHGEGGAGRVADGQARAVRRDHVAMRHAHAGRGAIPGEHDIRVIVDGGHVDDLAVIGGFYLAIQLELFHGIRDPACAEAFPCDHGGLAFAQQRPHGHFHRAGIGRGHDADAVIVGHAQNLAGAVDGGFQLRFAHGGAVRAAQGRVVQLGKVESGDLGAGARRKARIDRALGRLSGVRHGILPDMCPSLGKGVPRLAYAAFTGWCK